MELRSAGVKLSQERECGYWDISQANWCLNGETSTAVSGTVWEGQRSVSSSSGSCTWETKRSKDADEKSPWRWQLSNAAIGNLCNLHQRLPHAASRVPPCSSNTSLSHWQRICQIPLQRLVCIKDKPSIITTSNGFTPLSLVINVYNLDLWLKPCSGKGQCCGGHYCHSKGSPGTEPLANECVLSCLEEYKGIATDSHQSSDPFCSLEAECLSATQTSSDMSRKLEAKSWKWN